MLLIKWSLSGPSLTLRSPLNESPACLSSALAPCCLSDFEDNKDSCCRRCERRGHWPLAAYQRSAVPCARCYNPPGSEGSKQIVVLLTVRTGKELRQAGHAAQTNQPRFLPKAWHTTRFQPVLPNNQVPSLTGRSNSGPITAFSYMLVKKSQARGGGTYGRRQLHPG